MARSVFYVECDPDPALAHLHEPAGSGRGATVLFVPAFGWDEVSSAPIRRQWADRLAAEGHPALRIDLPGAGDSGGKPTDPGRVAAWTAAVAGAAATLRSRYPQRRVVAICLGIGGLIAWASAADGAAIDDLVLWSTPCQGRTSIRELRAFAALERDGSQDARAFAPGGYVLTDETAADIASINLAELPLPGAAARRLLIIGRDGISTDERLRQFAGRIHLPVTQATGEGWGEMMSGPHESVLPEKVVGLVSEWIDLGPVTPAVPEPGRRPTVGGALRAVTGARERPWSGQHGDEYRFGVLAEPLITQPRKLGVLLLSGEVSHGPNRMWVESARRWAPRGVPVLRLEIEEDVSSALAGGGYSREEKLYDHRYAARAGEAIADLTRAGVADRWLVVGLCAGASWAFHAALQRPRAISAAVLINPFVFDWEEDVAVAATVGAARRRGLDSWKRLAAGDVDPARVGAAARYAVRTPLEWRKRRRRMAARVEREVAQLDRLRAADTRVTLLIGQGEPLIDRLGEEGLLDQLDRWPNITLHRLPSRDHSFRSLSLQTLVHRMLDEAIEAELERLEAMPFIGSYGRMSTPEILAKSDLLR